MRSAGFIETRNWSALMAACDAMNKAAIVEWLGEIESGGGYVSTMVGGEVGAVSAAVRAGADTARHLGEFVSQNVISQIHPVVEERMIKGAVLQQPISESAALGIVEAYGYVAMVQAADSGVKAARVDLVGYFIPGGGHHAVIFRGDVAAIRSAVNRASEEAITVNKVLGTHVIPYLHHGLLACFPLGSNIENRPLVDFHEARGFIETKGFIPIIEATDAGLKSADVQALGWQKVGSGLMSVIFGGDVGAVYTAVNSGVERAAKVGEVISSFVLPGPHEAVHLVIPQPKKKK